MLCTIRAANYHLPGSTAQASRGQTPVKNRILIAELARGCSPGNETRTYDVKRMVEVIVPPEIAQAWNPTLGLEDLRLFWTAREGLCATASAMRRADPDEPDDGGALEIVLLTFDDDLSITSVRPLRGAWSAGHQKNWSPYQGVETFRALYSPLAGGVHDANGRIVDTYEPVHVTALSSAALRDVVGPHATHASADAHPTLRNQRRFTTGSMDVHIRSGANPVASASTAPRLALRGGTQLVKTRTVDGVDRWLSLAHGCTVGFTKFYWHRFYEVDIDGALLSLSPPFKLDPEHGIEFAAGMALDDDGDTLHVSFGVEDDRAMIGRTRASQVRALLVDL